MKYHDQNAWDEHAKRIYEIAFFTKKGTTVAGMRAELLSEIERISIDHQYGDDWTEHIRRMNNISGITNMDAMIYRIARELVYMESEHGYGHYVMCR